MASVLKSSYTMKVVPGDEYEWEMEAFFHNFKTKELEPLSSSPHSTPRHLKQSFGFIEFMEQVDSEILKIVNIKGEEIHLKFDKLSPLLDDKDCKMKKTLIQLKPSGCTSVVKSLNKLLVAFHDPENKVIIPSSVSEEELKSSKTCDNALNKVPTDISDYSQASGSEHVQTLSVSINRSKDSYKNSVSLLEKSSQSSSATTSPPAAKKSKLGEENQCSEGDENMLREIALIIKDAEFLGVKFQNIEIPKMVKIDPVRVTKLKESIRRAPDKTQCFVGLVKVVNAEGDQVGRHQCWVNGELYVAMMELGMESDDEDQGRVLSVIHTVVEGDGIDSSVIGSFLLNNSKEFAAILHQNLNYQDLLRFACVTLTSENSERSKTFLKTTLRGFTKGFKNANFFIKFASLPIQFLNKFDKFVILFEEGSLHGMKLSYRKRISLDKESKKKESCKLEMPLQFLKSHLKVSHETREKLLDTLLTKEITFSQYKLHLMKAEELLSVKKQVETMSGKEFDEVKERHPEMLSDQVLMEFSGAKTQPSGQNVKYLKLAKHVEGVMSSVVLKEGNKRAAAEVNFKQFEEMNLSDTIKLVNEHDIVVIVKGDDKNFNDKFEFAMKEHVLSNSAIGVFVDPNITTVKSGLEYLEEEKPEIKLEAVFVRKTKPVVEGGFRREYFPAFVYGNSKLFKDKEISTLFPHYLKDAIPLLLQQVTELNSKVIYAFSDEENAFDVDPHYVLGRRNVSVCYVSGKEILDIMEIKQGRKKL
jgi:hypothetical protein